MIVASGTVVTGTGVLLYYAYFKHHKKSIRVISKKEVKYVFFSPDGKPVIMQEHDVFDVKQKYDDGVLPSVIAAEYGMTAVMVCRIINCLKSI